jgi:hypothetical protein
MTCGGERRPIGSAMMCPACSAEFCRLVTGPEQPEAPEPEPENPVFPRRMVSRCVNGHQWDVEMAWRVIHNDPLMRVSDGCMPARCPTCGFPTSGFQSKEGAR